MAIFNGKIHYKWPFSIAMLVHQESYLTHASIFVDGWWLWAIDFRSIYWTGNRKMLDHRAYRAQNPPNRTWVVRSGSNFLSTEWILSSKPFMTMAKNSVKKLRSVSAGCASWRCIDWKMLGWTWCPCSPTSPYIHKSSETLGGKTLMQNQLCLSKPNVVGGWGCWSNCKQARCDMEGVGVRIK